MKKVFSSKPDAITEQRCINYGGVSGYTSKPLHDYIYECNQSNHLNFVATEEEAVRRLSV